MIPNEKLCWLTNRWSNVGVNELGEYLETVQDCCKDLFTKGSFCFGVTLCHIIFLNMHCGVIRAVGREKGRRALKGTLCLQACSLGEMCNIYMAIEQTTGLQLHTSCVFLLQFWTNGALFI